MTQMINGFEIRISGRVQGVGFRPYIWHLANDMGLAGSVFNQGDAVNIQIQADPVLLQHFLHRLQSELPPLAEIQRIDIQLLQTEPFDGFAILPSVKSHITTGCPPDAAICPVCTAELFDPASRRFRYPFITCTQCGPRLSVIHQLPYDRASTSMQPFENCSTCQVEYRDPENRRFHDQGISCPECGPSVWLEDKRGNVIAADEPFQSLRTALEAGRIIALKGVGGFYLVCDATNESAVALLRERKHRPAKPFALMVRNLTILKQFAVVEGTAAQSLQSAQAPVVLLEPCDQPTLAIAPNIAPGQYQLGCMLPYSPIHQLLFEQIDRPLVMTSGNRVGLPQAITNAEARAQLSEIADLFLMHNREIVARVDDSVVRLAPRGRYPIRLGRGHSPVALPLPPGFEGAPDLIALGGELKNTLCFVHAGNAIISQHLGDLGSHQGYESYLQNLDHFRQLYHIETNRLACDLHPEYHSSKLAETLTQQGYRSLRVQHHHAHLAACLGENTYPMDGERVLGICLDGSGFGSDGSIWGGEFLLGDYRMFNRVAHLKPFPLLGGTQAILQPWRLLYAQLRQAFSPEIWPVLFELFPLLKQPSCDLFEKMLQQQLNTPLTSSAGRLFDAVAAALGCHAEQISYEGQAAMELESLAHQGADDVSPYPFSVEEGVIDPAPMWRCLIHDLQVGERSYPDMARAFHRGFVLALTAMTQQLADQFAFKTIALSGGVMQNMLVQAALQDALVGLGYDVLIHKKLPANDAGLSFGQALVAVAQALPE